MANRRLRKELLETARGLYELGAIGGTTMREFETLRVEAPKVYSAYEIKRPRLKEKASQAVFAAYLNTSVSTVQKWEIGEKKPSGPALKLLDLVERKGLKVLAADLPPKQGAPKLQSSAARKLARDALRGSRAR